MELWKEPCFYKYRDTVEVKLSGKNTEGTGPLFACLVPSFYLKNYLKRSKGDKSYGREEGTEEESGRCDCHGDRGWLRHRLRRVF